MTPAVELRHLLTTIKQRLDLVTHIGPDLTGYSFQLFSLLHSHAINALLPLAVPHGAAPEWQPIEQPPDVEGDHSHRFLGILADGHHVFCQFTPWYLGHPDEHKGLWIVEGSGWALKPTHWMPLPDSPNLPAAPARAVQEPPE